MIYLWIWLFLGILMFCWVEWMSIKNLECEHHPESEEFLNNRLTSLAFCIVSWPLILIGFVWNS